MYDAVKRVVWGALFYLGLAGVAAAQPIFPYTQDPITGAVTFRVPVSMPNGQAIVGTLPGINTQQPFYFPTYGQHSLSEVSLSDSAGMSDAAGGFVDAAYFQNSFTDLTTYSNLHSYYGLRVSTLGNYTAPGGSPPQTATFGLSTANIVALNAYGMGNTSSGVGVSGINANAFQTGVGIGSNEFAVENTQGHSLSLAAVQAELLNNSAPADSSHQAYDYLATDNSSFAPTGFIGFQGTAAPKYGLDFTGATVSTAWIIAPASLTGNVGTTIQYSAANGGAYSLYDRSGKAFTWTIDGTLAAFVNANGIYTEGVYTSGAGTGISASGATSCVIKTIVGGLVTSATCS